MEKTLSRTASLAQLQLNDACYLVTDLDKKIKGMLVVKIEQNNQKVLQFKGVQGKIFWSKTLKSLYSLVIF